MALTFEWDSRKAEVNRGKHGVTFEEASTAFGDPLSITVGDPDHSAEEHRCILVGQSGRGRLLVVVHVARGNNLRIISARPATRRERRAYEEGQ